MQELNERGIVSIMAVKGMELSDWQRWASYAAVVWSLVYVVLGIYYLVSGRGFPLASDTGSLSMGPMIE